MNELKQKAAIAALDYIEDNSILGVGTGSTVNFLIEALANIKHRIDACVASSKATETRLKAIGIPVIDLNVAGELPLYIDGADEVNKQRETIKGGGGALTREKILATAAERFICIVDEAKVVSQLGKFPVAVEVLPLARSFVAREIVALGGDPVYREGFITDNGNIILDIYNLTINQPQTLEKAIKIIPGVVENGLFAQRLADKVIVGSSNGVTTF
ncbi:ribose-5-phosphate isomerase RpiA [Legionella gresilensis]|uniref:ribose-5-phosphate isomerase RpiA n=1 Tax=Legionella gresilensis TaxID=91823 RepID=UPI001040FD27|nr:ribose-5-phosphate isomerase RpiA [Legionella gresilensis]